LYNPQRLNDETIEQIFVVRTGIFNQLIDKLQKEKPKGIPQHYLIIGQRGMGKTTLLKRIEVELRKKEFSERFIPLLLPEEQYNLKNLAEFWLNSLDALADTLEFEKHTTEVQQVDAKVKELQQIEDKTDLAKEAYQFLKSFCLTFNRRPVLLIDNMSLIFDRMGKDEQHTLRAWLMQNGAPILLGASATTIEDTFNYGAPFYDAFQIHHLKKLSFEELVEIITNLAKLTQEETILPELQGRIARLKTLHQLTGGNPRTATMLFRVVIKGFSKEINDDLEALLDEITPLYKARFEELPTQLQVIVDAIALNWDPILIEQLRKETRYENNQLSPQLKRLTEAGWIEKIVTHEGKGFAYQISERFFNIWFLMRRSSRRQKRELYCLSKFLESFYGEEIDNVVQNQLQSKACSVNHITYNLALAEIVKDDSLKLQLNLKSYNDLQALLVNEPEIGKKFDIEAIRGKSDWESIMNMYYENLEAKKYLEAKKLILSLIESSGQSNCVKSSFYIELGLLYQKYFKEYEESENAFIKAVGLDSDNIFAWNSLGNLYQDYLKKYEDAETSYKKAIELNNNLGIPKFNLIFLFRDKLNKYKEAEEVFNTIKDIREAKDSYWLNKTLFELYKHNKGIATEFVIKSLETIKAQLPQNTQDDWWRFGAVASKLGCGKWFIEILEDKGFDVILAPYFVALKAMDEKDTEGYLNSKAVEIREPARKIMEIMKSYNN
jgi:tetratricopeptide (TPR) repeat protein